MDYLDSEIIPLLQKNGINATALQRLKCGLVHGAYLLETADSCMVLRQLITVPDPHGSPVEKVHALHLESYKNGAPIPNILHEKLIRHGDTHLQLTEFIEGRHVIQSDEATAHEIGCSIGRFQKAATPAAHLLEADQKERHLLTRVINIAARGIQNPLQELHHLASVIYRNQQSHKLNHLLSVEDAPRGIIHYDIKPYNIIITSEKKAVLIDLDLARISFLAYDLCSAIYFFGFTEGKFNAPITQALIQGYESVRQLEPVEKKYLPDLLDYVIQYNVTAEKRIAALGQKSELPGHNIAKKIHAEFQSSGSTRLTFNKMLGNTISAER